MPNVKINDISLFYETEGSGEPIVFIAGFSADHTMWKEVADRLKKNYQVILFDNRGAGRSEIPEGPYSIEQMADDAVALIKHLNLAKAHFVGNSMGGFILQDLSHRYPHLVKSAIISNSAATIFSPFHFYLEAQFELLKANAPLASLIKAACSWVYSYQFLAQEGVLKTLVELGLQNPYPFTIKGYEGQYAALEKFESSTWANQISVPTLVISGDHDLVFREESVKWLASLIPNAEYTIFKGCGHLPPIEMPDHFTQVVTEFVNRHSG